jgi:hypothetical protein
MGGDDYGDGVYVNRIAPPDDGTRPLRPPPGQAEGSLCAALSGFGAPFDNQLWC